jgi:magnesium-protoporphyrin O-methyltransferase
MVCRQCHGFETVFDTRKAGRELNRYRSRGPRELTQLLIDAVKEGGVEGQTLLDVGGGIGAIQHELLKAGAGSAVAVEASPAYLWAAEEEAQRQGHRARMTYYLGDFVEIVQDIHPADIVTLDRVICCYPDVERLVGLSSQRATRLYAVIYPVDSWALRIMGRIFNSYMWLRRNPFRFFIHPTSAVDGLIRRGGFQQRFHHKTRLWQVAVYGR